MLFMAWSDSGDCIKAYCVPDSFSATSRIEVIIDGDVAAVLEPNEHNQYMVGRHETGQVGFSIDEQAFPGLSGTVNVELREADTGLLVYRRPPSAPVVPECLFRLETHLLPLWRLDAALKEQFRFWYDRIERHSAETVRQILAFHSFGSIFSSGRILFNNYDFYIHGHHKTVMMMHEPYEELAERLLIFSRLAADASQLLGERDALLFAPVMNVAADIKSFDEKELRQVLGRAHPDVLSLLADPVLRQLACATPGEPADRGGFARALSSLSEFALIGLRSQPASFVEGLSALTNVPIHEAEIQRNDGVSTLADRLRAIKWVEPLIENDLALYAQLEAAIKSADP